MKVKRTGNNVNIYDGERLILHLDKNGDTFTILHIFKRSRDIPLLASGSDSFPNFTLSQIYSSDYLNYRQTP